LLSVGVKLGWISEQLGHANAYVTAQHYAKQVEDATYREPMALLAGEVPADLLARLTASGSPQSASSGSAGE